MAKRHYQPDIHRETRDRLKDLIGDSATIQKQQNPNHPFKETVGTYYLIANMTNSIANIITI